MIARVRLRPEQNQKRYGRIAVERNLVGLRTLTRCYGRRGYGGVGVRRLHVAANERQADAQSTALTFTAQNRWRGDHAEHGERIA